MFDLCAFAETSELAAPGWTGIVTSHGVVPASRGQERVVAEFGARGGEVGGYHAGMRLLLLTTTGARQASVVPCRSITCPAAAAMW
jgi:hypothetical protein